MSVVTLTKMPLMANLSYTQPGRDRFESGSPSGSVCGLAWADKAGDLYLEESDDNGASWSETATVAVPANKTTSLAWTELTKRQYRFRYVNGAVAQTKFRLIQQTRDLDLVPVQLGSLEDKIDAINDVLDAIVNGTAPAVTQLAEGTELVGEVGIDQTTDGTTNRVVAKISQTAGENLVQLSGSKPEQASAQYTEVAAEVKEYTKAAGASQIEVYCEVGYVRIRTDGVACTSTTGEPLAEGFGSGWLADKVSVYYMDNSTITVVSR